MIKSLFVINIILLLFLPLVCCTPSQQGNLPEFSFYDSSGKRHSTNVFREGIFLVYTIEKNIVQSKKIDEWVSTFETTSKIKLNKIWVGVKELNFKSEWIHTEETESFRAFVDGSIDPPDMLFIFKNGNMTFSDYASLINKKSLIKNLLETAELPEASFDVAHLIGLDLSPLARRNDTKHEMHYYILLSDINVNCGDSSILSVINERELRDNTHIVLFGEYSDDDVYLLKHNLQLRYEIFYDYGTAQNVFVEVLKSNYMNIPNMILECSNGSIVNNYLIIGDCDDIKTQM